jgi:hypothetical protein
MSNVMFGGAMVTVETVAQHEGRMQGNEGRENGSRELYVLSSVVKWGVLVAAPEKASSDGGL